MEEFNEVSTLLKDFREFVIEAMDQDCHKDFDNKLDWLKVCFEQFKEEQEIMSEDQ